MLFLKPNSSKAAANDTALRKSDRRKLLSDILQKYPSISQDLVSEILCQHRTDVYKRKLNKDLVLYLRGPNPPEDEDGGNWVFNRTIHPIFLEIKYEQTYYYAPCLSMLTLCRDILPKVFIHALTSKYVCRGANLMTAGVVELPSNVKVYDLVCICAIGNPVPFAVGWYRAGDGSGIAVEVILGYGDDLWRMQCPKKKEEGDGLDDGHYGNDGFVDGVRVDALLPDQMQTDEQEQLGEQQQIEEQQIQPEPTPEEQTTPEQSQQQPDQEEKPDNNDLLIQLFYQSLVSIPDSTLPMPTSTYYSKYLIPILRQNDISLDQTSFKKLSYFFRFLHELNENDDDEGNHSPGFTLSDDYHLLRSIDKSHYLYRKAKKECAASPTIDKNAKTKVQTVPLYSIPKHIRQKLSLGEDLYDIQANQAKNEKRKGSGFLTMSECRTILFQYVFNHDLDQKKSIQLNDDLKSVLFPKKSILKQKKQPHSDNIPDTITKKQALEVWAQVLDKAYAIVKLPENDILVMKRGAPPRIRMEVEKRGGGGKKFITKVYGLEEYNIDVQLFTDDISKRFACSCTAEEIPSSSKKQVVVSIQGNLANDLQFLLTNGEEGKTDHGGIKKQGVLQYESLGIPKGVIDVVLKKGVGAKKKK